MWAKQAVCFNCWLIKTIYRPMSFYSDSGEVRRYPHILQKKATERTTSKVVREIAYLMRPGLTLVTSISAFTKLSLWQNYIAVDVLR